ncbi:response regulator [Aeoliella sp. ICT_H6.2]|uniref:Response regulator n=1 Tax=Aeoliella straminimaris TaxID=2954799 RepID=A0A9X2F6S9_9BACT|nr:response regulator [Aeoliella straminimaris]MCO6042637.1 response regulator [Aeoliella straminimaris]
MHDKNQEFVYLIEDDLETRNSLKACCQQAGYQVHCFDSAEQFLAAEPHQRPCCAVVDIRLSGGITGIALQSELKRRSISVPTIVISGYADVRTAVNCMRLGATTLLEKPIPPSDLLNAISDAIERDKVRHVISEHVHKLQSSLNQLTGRELEVLDSLLAGKLNKQIALELDVSQRTIEVDRSRILKKFNAANAAELAVKATELKMLKGLNCRFDPAEASPTGSALAMLQRSVGAN